MQLELPIATPRRDSAARMRGEDAAQACAEKARRVAAFDAEAARQFALEYLAKRGQASGEEITDACKARGFHGHDDRCFGSVFSVLSKRGLIRQVGSCERTKGHGASGGRIWATVR